MGKQKRKLTTAEKKAKKAYWQTHKIVFINGKQVLVKRDNSELCDEFILQNADPIWLHQNEMWEYMDQDIDPLDV